MRMGKYTRMFEITDAILALLEAGRPAVSYDEAMRLAVGVEGAPREVARRSVRAQYLGDPLLAERDGAVVRRTAGEVAALLSAPEYVVVDLETTGLGERENGITEIGAVRVRNGRVTEERFHTLVDPEMEISERVVQLTGITNGMVKGAPKIEEALPGFLDFAADAVLVAHNMPFDAAFLNHQGERLLGRELPHDTLCTVRLARRLLPDQPEFHLDDLAKRFGVEIGERHRSLGDVAATAAVLMRLLDLRGAICGS